MPLFNIRTLINVITRALILGMIVFGSITYIPKKDIELRNRIVIATIVVVLYALIDYFGGFLKKIRALLCKVLCGCDPEAEKESLDDLSDLDLDT